MIPKARFHAGLGAALVLVLGTSLHADSSLPAAQWGYSGGTVPE